MRRIYARALACALGLLIGNQAIAQTRTVALSGQQAPGLPAGETFSQFQRAVLNDDGQVALVASSGRLFGVWSEGAGGPLAPIANTNPTASGGARFTNFQRIVINDRGQLAIEATSTLGVGLWTSGVNGPLDLVLRTGQLAPFHPNGATVGQILGNSFGSTGSPPILNDEGQVALRGFISGPGINNTINNDKAIWWDRGSGVTPIMYARDTTTGLANGRDSIGFGQPVMNNSGQVAFTHFNAPNGITHEVVLADPNGTITTLASTADGFVDVSVTSPPRINDAGDLAYRATASGTGDGIWVRHHDNGPFRLASRTAPAPGVDGLTFGSMGDPLINSVGKVAFAAYLKGPSVSLPTGLFSIWSNAGGALAPVVLLGDEAPGLSDAVFKTINSSFSFNKIGQVAIQGTAGPTGGANGVTGLWATDKFGDLQLIAAAGDQLDVDNGVGIDLRTISNVSTLAPDVGGTGNEDGLASAFNEWGQLAFLATFTDGSRGVFVSNAVAVPEPTAICLVLACVIATLRRNPR